MESNELVDHNLLGLLSYSRDFILRSYNSFFISGHKIIRNSSYSSNNFKLTYAPSITGMIKTRRMKWAGHAARMGKRGMHI
jgi:hypothetical protein